MCISIVLCVKTKLPEHQAAVESRVREVAAEYGYGFGSGLDALHRGIKLLLTERFPGYCFYEIHDLTEEHCACDIDQDIRNQAKLGQHSPFFDFVKEILGLEVIMEISILLADNHSLEDNKLRSSAGSFGDFFQRLNTWCTWQEEGYEPVRNSYYIADSSPFIFTFVQGQQH